MAIKNRVTLLLICSIGVLGMSTVGAEVVFRELEVEEVQPGYFFRSFPRTEQALKNANGPIVYRQAGASWKAMEFTSEYLVEHFGEKRFFAVCTDDLGDTRRKAMREQPEGYQLAEVFEQIKTDPENAPYIQTYVCENIWVNVDSLSAERICLFNEVSNTDYARDFRYNDKLDLTLFIGSPRTIARMHSHRAVQVLMIEGEKEAYIISPEAMFALGCTNYGDDEVGRCLEDFREINLEEDMEILVYKTLLKPGDILYIPNKWGHQIHAQGNEPCVSLVYQTR